MPRTKGWWTRHTAPSDVHPLLGLPGFRDVAVIGRGGSATVYRAYQEKFARPVAVKVFSGVELSDGQTRRYFDRECRLTGRLSGHPNIVSVLDGGTNADGRPYLILAYFEGGSLAGLLKTQGPLPVDELLKFGIKLAGALETAHREGILHRDVKPENVLLSRYREPALADFGIAGLAASGTWLTSGAMTPVHAPPEILEGGTATVASDIYSLGSTLYAAITGRPAFALREGEGLLAGSLRILKEDPPAIERSDVPAELEEVVRTSMAKQAHDREDSSARFGQELQAIQATLQHPRTEMVLEPAGPVRSPSAPISGTPIVHPRQEMPGLHDPNSRQEPDLDSPEAATAAGRRVIEADSSPVEVRPTPWWGGRGRWVGAGLAVLLVGVLGAFWLVSGGSSVAPSVLTLSRTSNTDVALTWKDPTHGKYLFVVERAPPSPPIFVAYPSRGTTQVTVGSLDAGTDYCFRVGAITSSAPPKANVVWSAPACTGQAKAVFPSNG